MIDFSKLECQVASGAAVGIGVDEQNKDTFYLPIGYTALTTADEKKQAFFELYRLFKAYVTKNKLDPVKDTRSSQNGTVAKSDGYKLIVKDDDSETMLYTKVNFLDTIIDAFDPYAIQNIANRKLYSEEFELEDALNHLDDAVFMPNHAFMVDQAIVDKKQLVIEASELAQMFCFIYCDVKTQLQEENEIDAQYRYLGDRFKELHLFPQASLFEQDSFEQVKTILKDRLELIDHHTPIKDDEYWKLRDAIYAFLYGEPVKGVSDTYWGVKNFWPIWEDLCLEAVSKSQLSTRVILADTRRRDFFSGLKAISLNGKEIRYYPDCDYPYFIKHGNEIKYIYPDLIFGTLRLQIKEIFKNVLADLFDKEMINNYYGNIVKFNESACTILDGNYDKTYYNQESDANEFIRKINPRILVDFKYKSENCINELDKIKQFLYSHSLSTLSISEFWIPCVKKADDCTDKVPDYFLSIRGNGNLSFKKDELVRVRKINIENLVRSYVGGKNA